VLDIQPGWAVHEIERMQSRRGSTVIVVTWNPCPEHLRELIELDPDVLASGALLGPDLVPALADLATRAANGERFRLIPRVETILRPHEERVLRLLARGRTKREIAEALHLTVGRVNTITTAIHQALGLANDREVALYYWGEWQLFEEERRVRLIAPARGERA
jgi:DNA-binding NarL/FixJ family response regulator